MPVTMSGISSGIDTDKIIHDLVQVEKKPIYQLEATKKEHNLKKQALKVLRKHLADINDKLKDLYGFRASYFDKDSISSDKSVLDAKATKKAETGLKNIKVIRIASSHKISTDSIKVDKELPAGKFKIEVNGNSYNINFRGGRLKSLMEKIDEDASDIVTTSYIKTSGNNYILTLQSKVSGKKGEIKLSGKMDLLKRIGLIKGIKGEKKSKVDLIFDKRYFSSYLGKKKIDKQTGNIQVSRDGKSVSVKGLLWQEYVMPVEVLIKKGSIFEFDFNYNKLKDIEEEGAVPFRVETGPQEKINIKGILLKGYNVSRIREHEKKKKEKVFESLLGVGLVADDKGKRVEKIYSIDKDAKGKYEIPAGRDFAGKKIKKIIFYCNEGSTKFSKAIIKTPIKDKGLLDPKNIVSHPKDAKMNVDGVDIYRDKNNDLTDIIKGVTINIKRPSKKAVELNVLPNPDKAVTKIKDFVEAYNKYLEFNMELIKTGKAKKISINSEASSKRRRNRDKGLFVGDMTIMRLESSLRRGVSGVYPNRAEKQVKLFTQMGISTGKINADWESIKMGKLIVDEPKLKETILGNPEGILMFCGSDNDGDNRIDSGLAYRIMNILKPYITSGKGSVIATKIDLEDTSIKLADDRIDRHKQHLKKYEERLRSKFIKMEKALTKSKHQKNWMSNQFGSQKKSK